MKQILKLLAILGLATLASAQVTLTGSLKNADGTDFNGKIGLTISQPAAVSSTGSCGGPALVVPGRMATFPVVAGAIGGTAQVYSNACVTPTNTCYVVDEYDTNNNLLSEFRWTITATSGSVDVGTLTPNGPGCGQVPVGNSWTGPMTVVGDLNVLGTLNSVTQTFTNQTVDNITVNGLITGSLATTAPTGTGLKSTGSQYIGTDSILTGAGACPASQWVNENPADASPICSQPSFSDLAGLALRTQLPAEIAYTDAANTFNDATGLVIQNTSDHTKKVQTDLSSVATATTVTEKVPNVTGTVTRLYKETNINTLSVFLPGSLTSTWSALTWTPTIAIQVIRVDMTFKTAPSSCSTNAAVRMSDGTNNFDVAANNSASNNATGSALYAAGTPVTVSVRTAANGCSANPADAMVVYQYRMQ